MGTRRCMVKICNSQTNSYALPSNEILRRIWLERCGYQDSIEDPHKNVKVCPKHFGKACFRKTGKGLLRFSVPSVGLPNYIITGEEIDDFVFPYKEEILETPEETDIKQEPCTYFNRSPVAEPEIPRKTYSRQSDININTEVELTSLSKNPTKTEPAEDSSQAMILTETEAEPTSSIETTAPQVQVGSIAIVVSKSTIFTNREKMLLIELVIENLEVENKKTDALTVAEKNRAWERITTVFNSQPEVDTPRTSQQLRKLWANLKHRKRKETTALRHELLATSGGQTKRAKIDPVLEFVSLAAPNMDTTIDGPWDSADVHETDETICAIPSTSQSTDALLLGSDKPADPLAPVVPDESTDLPNVSATVSTKSVMSRTGEKLRRDILTEALHMQRELHNIKKRIAEEELLKVQEERKRSEERDQILKDVLKLQLQKAADEARLASLKLEHFQLEE